MTELPPPSPDVSSGPYRVLARKYRPTTFSELIGQEAMVRTLSNAIRSGRLAHAFILTGVRGIGKTSTARLIARGLNCIGPDGAGGPTVDPCGVCEHCRAIAQDRHVDVMEMDAASRTGVDDIRELIDGVRYKPTSARFKIYIVDEVHMLSKNAFNALLKTLEEPPEHVKFIFATTEIRKVPVTVLSRCQRFDLRRVDHDTLCAHFKAIAGKEGAEISDGALALIARAADGSVRDGLSLLDQAIAHGSGLVDEAQVRDMLGLADRERGFDLFEAAMKGDAATALDIVADQYRAGADPVVVLQDLLEIAHWLTRIKVAPAAAETAGVPEAERVRGRDMAARLSMAELGRAWQMLIKGLAEAAAAPSPLQAAEMILVRLAYAARLPTPADAVRALAEGGAQPQPQPSRAPPQAPSATVPASPGPGTEMPPPPDGTPMAMAVNGGPAPAPEPVAQARPDPDSFEAVIALARDLREPMLRANLVNNVHLVHFEPGRIEFHPGDHAPPELAQELGRFLNAHTGRRWVVSVSGAAGAPTLHQQSADAQAARIKAAGAEPVVRAVLEAFPGAVVEDVRPIIGGDVVAAEFIAETTDDGDESP